MEKKQMKHTGRLITGLLVGGVIGASVALLMAPQSGEQLRAQIRDKSAEIKDKTVHSVQDMTHDVEDKVKSTLNKAERKAREAKHHAEM